MHLKIPNLNEFISSFLAPLSKVNNTCVIKIAETGYSSLLSSADGALILYCSFKEKLDIEGTLNIPDLGRLIKILSCINSDETIDITFNDNNISYKSDDIRFKYHLLEDGIILAPPINIDKIKEIDYNTVIEITHESFLNLLKSSTFAVDTDKLYFFTKDGHVYGELTDQQKHNSDSVTRKLAGQYQGDPITDSIPISFDVMRTIANNRAEKIKVLVNTDLSILTFEVNIGNAKNVYVVTGFAKP